LHFPRRIAGARHHQQRPLGRVVALVLSLGTAAVAGLVAAATPAQAINPCDVPMPPPRCTPPPKPPPIAGTPSDLHIVGDFGASVTLAWTDNSPNEVGYQIDQWNSTVTAPGGPYGLPANMNQTDALAAHPGTGAMTYTITGLNPGAVYTFAVVAEGISSPYYANYTVSNFLTVPAFPTPPTLTISAVTDNSFTLQVTDTAQYATGFTISEESWPWYGGHTWTQIADQPWPPGPGGKYVGTTNTVRVGDAPDTHECFFASTYNGAGRALSAQVCATTSDPPPPPPAPPVTNLFGTASASGTSITWTWTGHQSDTGYDVILADVTTSLGLAWPKAHVDPNAKGVVSYTTPNLTPGHSYQLTVYAYEPGDAASSGKAATVALPSSGNAGAKSVAFYDCATTDRTVWLYANGGWTSIGTAHAPGPDDTCGPGGTTDPVTVALPAGIDVIASTVEGDRDPADDYKFWDAFLGNPSGPSSWVRETDSD
jgi:hypothetical protein